MQRLTVNLVSESEFSVQGHGVHTAYLEMRHLLEKQSGINLLVNAKPLADTDITHIHTIGLFSLLRLLSRRGGKKIVSAHMVPDSLVGSIVGARWWLPLFSRYLCWFYNHADTLIAVSPYTKQVLLKLGIKTPIVVINNSIDTYAYQTSTEQKAKLRRELHLSPNKFIVIGSGQIQPRKRFSTFIQVAATLPKFQFIWVGGIPFKAAGSDYIGLNHLIKHHPKNVLITGVVPQAEARKYTRAADVMFMPSIQETFGLSIVEGAASGLPVVVRDIADYNATFGQDVLRGDEHNFTELIQSLADDQDFYHKYQQKSHHLAQKYDSSRTASKLLAVYRKLAH